MSGQWGAPRDYEKVFFQAGVASAKGSDWRASELGRRATEHLLERSTAFGRPTNFELWQGDNERLAWVAAPHAVLVGHTLEHQGLAFGVWVCEAFPAVKDATIVMRA